MTRIAGSILMLGAALMAIKCSEYHSPQAITALAAIFMIYGVAFLASKGDVPTTRVAGAIVFLSVALMAVKCTDDREWQGLTWVMIVYFIIGGALLAPRRTAPGA